MHAILWNGFESAKGEQPRVARRSHKPQRFFYAIVIGDGEHLNPVSHARGNYRRVVFRFRFEPGRLMVTA